MNRLVGLLILVLWLPLAGCGDDSSSDEGGADGSSGSGANANGANGNGSGGGTGNATVAGSDCDLTESCSDCQFTIDCEAACENIVTICEDPACSENCDNTSDMQSCMLACAATGSTFTCLNIFFHCGEVSTSCQAASDCLEDNGFK